MECVIVADSSDTKRSNVSYRRNFSYQEEVCNTIARRSQGAMFVMSLRLIPYFGAGYGLNVRVVRCA